MIAQMSVLYPLIHCLLRGDANVQEARFPCTLCSARRPKLDLSIALTGAERLPAVRISG